MTYDDRASASAFAEALASLEEAAKAHKRSAAFHRSTARQLMQAREQLVSECERLGIPLRIEP